MTCLGSLPSRSEGPLGKFAEGYFLPNQIYPQKHILLVDPDEAFGQVLQQVLGANYALDRAPDAGRAVALLGDKSLNVILLNLDLQNGGADPCALLTALSERESAPPVIAFGWESGRKKAIEALRNGAVDFLEQPLDVQALKFALDGACRRAALARDLAAAQKFLSSMHVEGLLGNSEPMEQVNEVVGKVAGVHTSVLITGESGTGKGVVARAIHNLSQRADKPFVAFSACAFPESLIEDELFGHEKGAFTGASQMRRGRFEEAKGGTVFLDEIGDLPLPLQAKLLRVLQERSVERLGSNVSHPIDVRVICATSRNLEEMVQKGTFREDLYFRVSVVRVHMPPLRERAEDIPLLAEYFLKIFAKAHNKQLRGLKLRGYTIPEEVPGGTFHEAVRTFKRELVRSALRMHSGNKLRAAKELGISRCYLHRLVNQLDIPGVKPEDDSEENESRRPSGVRAGTEELRMGARAV